MSERIVCNDNGEGGGVESITAKLREQAERIDLWAARQSEHGFSPISIDMRSEVDRIDWYIRELKDEINRLNAELHGAEIEAKKLRVLVRQMAYVISPTSREHMLVNLAMLGIEVE